jgi:hypothetical protein
LKFRSKVKYENISKFLGYDFLYPPESWNHHQKNIGHRKLPQAFLIKDLSEIMKLLFVFCSPLALKVLEKKIFKDFFWFSTSFLEIIRDSGIPC